MEGNQFDTIYHEHFSYFSFLTTVNILAAPASRFSTSRSSLPTAARCGSMRDTLKRLSHACIRARAANCSLREETAGFNRLETYFSFDEKVKETKRKLLDFLIEAKQDGKSIVGYGAPGKGNTLLNYCGIRTDFLDYTVDRNPYKHGQFLPGTHIPIFSPEKIRETRPDYVLILPWNLPDEIREQMADIREWGGQFVVPDPGGGGVPVIFTETRLKGAFVLELESARMSGAFSRAPGAGRVRGPRPEPASRSATSPSTG